MNERGPARASPTDAALLVTGKGTRLQSVVADRPKLRTMVRGRPFIEWPLMALVSGLHCFRCMEQTFADMV